MAAATRIVKPAENNNNLETYCLVWLDPAVKDDKDYADAQKKLRNSINYIKAFDNVEQCESYLQSVWKEERIILIVSAQFGQDILSRIHSLGQLFSVYIHVYGQNSKAAKDWIKNFTKIKMVSDKLNAIVDQILEDQKTRSRNKVAEFLSINVFNAAQKEEKSSTGLNGDFVNSQLLIDFLLRMEPRATDKYTLIDLCKQYYKDNTTELAIINEFEKEYTSTRALWWYTRESFLYRLLNKALRMRDIDLLFLFRFFIRDIHKQLQNLQSSSSIHVYRGQIISNDELQVLKESVGQFISMNSFLSTSLDRRQALSFLMSSTLSDTHQRILFEIDLDPSISGIKPFANITSSSYFSDEQEVLIMLGSIFRLVSIDFQNKVWVVQMTLCGDSDNSLKSVYDYMSNEYGISDMGSNFFSYGRLLFKMGEYEKAEKFYERLISELPQDHPDLAPSYHNLGVIANQKGNYNSSIERFNKSIEIYTKTRQPDDPVLADGYNSIGEVYSRQGNQKSALEVFHKALAIRTKAFGEDNLQTALCYHNIGNAYQAEKKLLEAFECHQKVFQIRHKHLPADHADLGATLNCIGSVYLCLNYPDQALEVYNKALNIYEKSLTAQHPDIAMTHYNLGLLHAGKNSFEQALAHFQKASTLFRATLPPTHPFIGIVDKDIRRVSDQLK